MTATHSDRLSLIGGQTEYSDRVLTPQALEFVAQLHRKFNPEREHLLARRRERQAAINEFGSALDTSDLSGRARALRRVVENASLCRKEMDRAFVLMQYFGSCGVIRTRDQT